MRDILDLFENIILDESRGLAGRKPGDTFRNTKGEEVTFDNIVFYPESGGKYTPEQMDAAIGQVQQQADNIRWQNARTAKNGGFGIATFMGPNGPIYVGRYLEKTSPDPMQNKVPNEFDDFKFSGKAAAKVQAGLTPQDLLTDKLNLTIPKIMNQLAKSLGTDSPLYEVAHRIAMGEGLPLSFSAPEGISFSAFRDYFCEILQPMAIVNGVYTGNAGEAAEIFMDGTFENCLISFDDSKNAGLSDSILTNPDGKEVKISSKGGKGAMASVSNLIDGVNDLQSTANGRKLLKKYSIVIDLVRDIKAAGQAGAPLLLGEKYGVINDKEAKQIRALKTMAPIPYDSITQTKISPNLKKLATIKKPENLEQVNLYYHLIAVVAQLAAEQVNEQTNFSKAAADILNNGALVQVYTKAKEGKTEWVLQAFDTVYPGESIKGVYLSAGKNYFSTGIKGSYSFKIDKGTGVAKEKLADAPAAVGVSDIDLATASQRITGGPYRDKAQSRDAVSSVGRTKRR
jgi:arginine repressor